LIHADVIQNLFQPAHGDGRLFGVVVGIVTNNRDPENMHRVKVRFPWLNRDDESNWARVASPMAGNGRGAYFLPEVDDEVLVAFEHGSVEHPYVIGSLWNGRDTAPENNRDGANNNRALKSRSGHVVRLSDRSGQESIEIIDKTGNNKITIHASGNKIAIEAQGDITMTSKTGKVSISAVGIELKSQAGVKIQAAQSVDVSATAQANVKAAMINLN
jgi:uncharacterized protein involved in type VI secretion and phage assembly